MEPLAERMRPHTLDQYVGQKQIVGEGAYTLTQIILGLKISLGSL